MSWEEEARTKFVVKVFGIVAAQVALTIAVVILATWAASSTSWARLVECSRASMWELRLMPQCRNTSNDLSDPTVQGLLILSSVLQFSIVLPIVGCEVECSYLASLVLLGCLHLYKRRYPVNYILLFGFTLLTAMTIGNVCANLTLDGQGHIIQSAAIMTTTCFGGLSLYALRSGTDFSCLRGWLLVVLLGFCTIQFGEYWFHSSALSTSKWYSYTGVALFSGFILYDVDHISKRDGMLLDNYILGAVELYLDIVNLFLHFVGAKSEKKGK